MIEIESHTISVMTDMIVDVTMIERTINDTTLKMIIGAVIDVMMKSDTTVENMIVKSITNVAYL